MIPGVIIPSISMRHTSEIWKSVSNIDLNLGLSDVHGYHLVFVDEGNILWAPPLEETEKPCLVSARLPLGRGSYAILKPGTFLQASWGAGTAANEVVENGLKPIDKKQIDWQIYAQPEARISTTGSIRP